jgi:hypothetical protein
MERLMRLPRAVRRDPAIDPWLEGQPGGLASVARHWFEVMRACGDDVRELLHDDYATACVDDLAFAYVGVFKAHVNVGFFRGLDLPDPSGLLEGTGKLMRHVKVRPGRPIEDGAVRALIQAAYQDMKSRLRHSPA